MKKTEKMESREKMEDQLRAIWEKARAHDSSAVKERRRKQSEALIAKGARMEARNEKEGWSALMSALVRGDLAEAIWAIERVGEGALDLKSKHEGAPLIMALDRGDEEKARALIEAGAKVSVFDASGSSALALAVRNVTGCDELIEAMVQKGASPLERRRNGQSGWSMAGQNGDLGESLALFKAMSPDQKSEVWESRGEDRLLARLQRGSQVGDVASLESLEPVLEQIKDRGEWEKANGGWKALLVSLSEEPIEMIEAIAKAGGLPPKASEAPAWAEVVGGWLMADDLDAETILRVSEWVCSSWDPMEALAWRHQTLGRALTETDPEESPSLKAFETVAKAKLEAMMLERQGVLAKSGGSKAGRKSMRM